MSRRNGQIRLLLPTTTTTALLVLNFFTFSIRGATLTNTAKTPVTKYPLEQMQKSAKTPPTNGTGPSRVLIGIYIESMGNFQSADMSFDVDLYLYSHWQDASLRHNNAEYVLVTDPKVRERIWLPDLYFANARTSKFHDVTIPNFSLFIDREGNIAYSTRVTLNVACNLELANYPMDSQRCGIRMVSYAYVESQVNVTWFKLGATRYNPEIGLPEFKIVKLTADTCDGSYMYAIMSDSYRYDKFSCLEAVIHLNRQIGYHVVQSFIPTGLIVMISWVSFWIDRRAVPARVTLSFTTLLSLSTLGNGLRFNLPQVAYAKAIDFWFGSCMFFVFLSLVEFAAVNSYMREAEKYERLASYSAKKEMHMMSDEGNQWICSDDDDTASLSRSPMIVRPKPPKKSSSPAAARTAGPVAELPNGKMSGGGRHTTTAAAAAAAGTQQQQPLLLNCGGCIMQQPAALNCSGGGGGGGNIDSSSLLRGDAQMGAKLRHWTSHAIAIPSLFGRRSSTELNNNNNHQHNHQNHLHHQHSHQNGPMRLMRHPSISAEKILTVEHFEQLAEKRQQQQSASARTRAAAAEQPQQPLRPIDADDECASLVSPPPARRKRTTPLPHSPLVTTTTATAASTAAPLPPARPTSMKPPLGNSPPQPHPHRLPPPSGQVAAAADRRNNNNCTVAAPASRSCSPATTRKRTIVPAIHPWPPSPMQQQHPSKAGGAGAKQPPPPVAPRQFRQVQLQQSITKEAAVAACGLGNPMATNHFLREGFRFSRKGLNIDKWSRLLFPLVFTMWNMYYWTYYLWYIQRHPAASN